MWRVGKSANQAIRRVTCSFPYRYTGWLRFRVGASVTGSYMPTRRRGGRNGQRGLTGDWVAAICGHVGGDGRYGSNTGDCTVGQLVATPGW